MVRSLIAKIAVIVAAALIAALTQCALAGGPLTIDALLAMRGGFPENAEMHAGRQGLSLSEFLSLHKRSAASMLPDELGKITAIRDAQAKPSPSEPIQKVVPACDICRYATGAKKVRGFVTLCRDVAHYRTVSDFYYGLRLDYPGTRFAPDMESIGIIRFRARNAGKCIVPRSAVLGGEFSDPYPFGGHGFTTGTNGRLGAPEWVMPESAELEDGSAIFEMRSDGTERLIATYKRGRFVMEAGSGK